MGCSQGGWARLPQDLVRDIAWRASQAETPVAQTLRRMALVCKAWKAALCPPESSRLNLQYLAIREFEHLKPDAQISLSEGWLKCLGYTGDCDILRRYIKRLDSQSVASLFFKAASRGCPDMMAMLLDHGVDRTKAPLPADYTALHCTTLHCAVRKGRVDLVKTLLADNKVDPSTEARSWKTALHAAASSGQIEVLRVLLPSDSVDPNTSLDELSATALHVAAENNRFEVVQALLADRRVDPNLPNKWGVTAFFEAAEKGSVEMVQAFLADKRVDPRTQNQDGETVLHVARKWRRFEVVQVLLADGRVDSKVRSDQ